MEDKSTSKKPRARPQRASLGVRNRLVITNKDPNRHYHLFDNDPARIDEMLARGYRIDTMRDHLPGAERLESGKTTENVLHVGGGRTQVLMSIEKEYYDEDQAAKQEHVNAREAGLQPNSSEGLSGSIKIQR